MAIRPRFLVILCLLIFASAVWAEDQVVLAVMYFDSPVQDDSFPFFQKAINEMLVIDLSKVDGVELVERENLEGLVEELKLGLSGLVDEDTAPQIGEMLGARYIITGTIFFLKETLMVSFKVSETESGKILTAGKVNGGKNDLAELETLLSGEVLSEMKILFPAIKLPEKTVAKAQGVTYDTITRYGRALDSKDNKDYEAARDILESLTKDVPELTYARDELDKVKERIKLYDTLRRDAFAEQNKGQVDWPVFYQTIMGYGTSMQLNALLEYCERFEADPPQAPPGYLFSGPEILHYYKHYALHFLNRLEDAVAVGEEFLKLYPTSMYYQSVKVYLTQDVNTLKEKQKVTIQGDPTIAEYLKEIEKARTESKKQYYYYLIASQLSGKQLYREALDYLQKIDIKTIEKEYITGDMILYALFMCYYGLQQRQPALDVYEKMEKSYPDSGFLSAMDSMLVFIGE